MKFFKRFFRNRGLREWGKLADKIQDEKTRQYFINFVKNFYIPDCIDIKKLQGNSQILQYHNRSLAISFISLENNIEDFTQFATPSIDGIAAIGSKPLGYDDWFIIAYPDVVEWVMNLNNQEFINTVGVGNPNDETLFYDSEKKIKSEILRKIVNNYLATSKTLECGK